MADTKDMIADIIENLITEVEEALTLSGDVEYGAKGGGVQQNLPHVRVVSEDEHDITPYAVGNADEFTLKFVIVAVNIDLTKSPSAAELDNLYRAADIYDKIAGTSARKISAYCKEARPTGLIANYEVESVAGQHSACRVECYMIKKH